MTLLHIGASIRNWGGGSSEITVPFKYHLLNDSNIYNGLTNVDYDVPVGTSVTIYFELESYVIDYVPYGALTVWHWRWQEYTDHWNPPYTNSGGQNLFAIYSTNTEIYKNVVFDPFQVGTLNLDYKVDGNVGYGNLTLTSGPPKIFGMGLDFPRVFDAVAISQDIELPAGDYTATAIVNTKHPNIPVYFEKPFNFSIAYKDTADVKLEFNSLPIDVSWLWWLLGIGAVGASGYLGYRWMKRRKR